MTFGQVVECRNWSQNLIVYLLYLFIAMSKKPESLWNFCIKIMQPFLYLEAAKKLISQELFKNTKTKIFKIQQKFYHLTTCPNDMIQT